MAAQMAPQCHLRAGIQADHMLGRSITSPERRGYGHCVAEYRGGGVLQQDVHVHSCVCGWSAYITTYGSYIHISASRNTHCVLFHRAEWGLCRARCRDNVRWIESGIQLSQTEGILISSSKSLWTNNSWAGLSTDPSQESLLHDIVLMRPQKNRLCTTLWIRDFEETSNEIFLLVIELPSW